MIVSERSRSEVVNFDCQYRVTFECSKKYAIRMDGGKMETALEYIHYGSILCKHGSMEGEEG